MRLARNCSSVDVPAVEPWCAPLYTCTSTCAQRSSVTSVCSEGRSISVAEEGTSATVNGRMHQDPLLRARLDTAGDRIEDSDGDLGEEAVRTDDEEEEIGERLGAHRENGHSAREWRRAGKNGWVQCSGRRAGAVLAMAHAQQATRKRARAEPQCVRRHSCPPTLGGRAAQRLQ